MFCGCPHKSFSGGDLVAEEDRFFRRAAVYLRKSRAEEGEDTGAVLARHKARLADFAARYHVRVVKTYEEIVSGDSLFARPRMLELLHDIEDGRYTGVLCMDIDRLGRGNMKEQGLILETFKSAGTAIITPDHIYDLNNELDETATEFKTFMARQELKIIKKRLNRGRLMTIEKGGYVAEAPFGYVRSHEGKLPTLAPHPEEAAVVRQIFGWYAAGEGCPSICRRLSAMGVRPRRGETFSRNSVRKILTNPVYIGKVVWGRKRTVSPRNEGEKGRSVCVPRGEWLTADGLHPPLIEEETFREAGEILAGRYHPPYRETDKLVNPFAGILFCRRCGRAMTLRTYGGRPYQAAHFLCPSPGCVCSARADHVEKAVVEALKDCLSGLEIAENSGEEDENGSQARSFLEKTRAEQSRLTGQRGRLCDLLERGVYSEELFSERERQLSARIEAVKEDIGKAQAELCAEKERAGIRLPRIRSLLQEYDDASPAEKNALLKSVVRCAYYFKEKGASPGDFSVEIRLRTGES